MEWFIAIIIALGAGLIFGFAKREKNKKINVFWLCMVGIISILLVGFMPLLITLWCAMAYYLHRSRYPVGINNDPGWRGFVAFMVVGFIFIFLYMSIPATTETVEVENVSLTALRSTVATSGDFFLGSGSVDGTFYYVYGYMQGPEYIQGLIEKTPNVHVYPNKTEENGYITSYESYNFRNLSSWPINLAFNGAPERTSKASWTNICIPPDSIMQGMKI
jgi:hypothetical protein